MKFAIEIKTNSKAKLMLQTKFKKNLIVFPVKIKNRTFESQLLNTI